MNFPLSVSLHLLNKANRILQFFPNIIKVIEHESHFYKWKNNTYFMLSVSITTRPEMYFLIVVFE